MSSIIQRHKRLIKKLRDKEQVDMYIGIELDIEIKSRVNLIHNYSKICNNIYSGVGGSPEILEEVKIIIENKKRNIAYLLQKKIESKRELRKIHKQLSELL